MTEPIHISAPVYGGSGEYTLICTGVLNGLSYRTVRDSVVKAALEEPRVVIVDVNELRVPEASAWSVFTSARWHVSTWPDVPILLVCASDEVRAVIGRRGITRWVPVFPTMQEAMQSAGSSRPDSGAAHARTCRRTSAASSTHNGWSAAGCPAGPART